MSSRYDNLQLGTAKVAAENERLLLEIQKEREEGEQSRLEATKISAKNEQLKEEIEKV